MILNLPVNSKYHYSCTNAQLNVIPYIWTIAL